MTDKLSVLISIGASKISCDLERDDSEFSDLLSGWVKRKVNEFVKPEPLAVAAPHFSPDKAPDYSPVIKVEPAALVQEMIPVAPDTEEQEEGRGSRKKRLRREREVRESEDA